MKKYIIASLIGFAFIVSPVQAQTVQEQYVSALQQIIVLLTQQVGMLLQQLNALQIAPPSAPVPVTVITPTVYPTAPTFGSTPPPVVTPPNQPVVPVQPVLTPIPINPQISIQSIKDCNIGAEATIVGTCQVTILYTENGQKRDTTVTATSEKGTFKLGTTTGNPLTFFGSTFNYIPDSTNVEKEIEYIYGHTQINYLLPLIITVSASGVTSTSQFGVSSHFLYSTTTNSVIGNLY